MQRDVSCFTTKAIIEYVIKQNRGNVGGLLENLGPDMAGIANPLEYLMDENNWISAEVDRRLFENARNLLKDDLVAYKLGFETVKNKGFGYIQLIFIRALGNPKMVFTIMQKVNDKFNRTKKVEVVNLNNDSAITRLHWFKHLPLTKDFCLINQGIYAGMPLVWGLPPAELAETKCYFNGDPYCEYHLKWSEKTTFWSFWLKLGNAFSSHKLLQKAILEIEKDKELLQKKYSEIHHLNTELQHKIRHLEALQTAGKAVLTHNHKKELFDTILRLLVSTLGFKRAILFAVDRQEKVIFPLEATGEKEKKIYRLVMDCRIPLSRTSNVLVRTALEGKPIFIKKVSEAPLNKENILLKSLNPSSFVVVPLVAESEVRGLLAVDKGENGEPISEDEKDLVVDFSSHIALAFQKVGFIEDLAIQNQLLEKRVADRTHQLSEANEKLLRWDKFRAEFLSVATHDIRGAITPIVGFSQLLVKDSSALDPKKAAYIQHIYDGSSHLLNIVNDLLDRAKIEAGKMELYTTQADIKEILLDVKDLYELQSNQKNISFDLEFDDLPQIYIDTVKIKQVVINLVANALKFTPAGGQVKVKATTHLSQVEVSVSDTGPGIKTENLDKLFRPFSQIHLSGQPGTGLGLYIVKNLVELHGGKVFVNSKPGKGTTFGFTLPVSADRKEYK